MVHVLVVDDDEPNREVICAALEYAGHVVGEAASGEQALGLLRWGQGRVVLLADLLMPGMGGEALVAAVAGDPGLRARCACVLTTASTLPIAPAVLACLAVPPLRKPFDLEDLESAVGRASECLDRRPIGGPGPAAGR